LAILVSIFTASCSQPVQHAAGPAVAYSNATGFFEKGDFRQAIDRTDDLAKASPPNEYTNRARVLRAVIFSGQMEAFEELADAYSKGMDKSQRPQVKSEYNNRRRDTVQMGGQKALHLVEVAHQLTQGGALPKDLILDTPYPKTEAPAAVAQLNQVTAGILIGPDDQEAAAVDAQRKAIADALGGALGGDRATARNALKAGPATLDGVTFALFLAKQLLNGATIFDRHHLHDTEKLKTMCGEADDAINAALAALKEKPDKQKEKDVKKLQDQIKTTLKNG
jgi:hypothetical protein